MKSLRYILCVLGATLAVGCNPIEEDHYLIEGFDHTAPAYVMFVQSMKGICAASGSLVSALNFNEWLNAPDEESRLDVEDRYYTYYKLREREENLWNIYAENYSEQYFLRNGLTLNEEGAVWEARQHPTFFHLLDSTISPTISHIADDKFEVVFENVPIAVGLYPYDTLFKYLHSWQRNYDTATLSAELSVATNNAEFRAGDAPLLQFVITGSGRLYDQNQGYEVAFEITEPLRVSFEDNGLIASNKASVGTMHITNSLGEWADVSMTPYNTIVIDYHPKDSAPVRGYYNWNGASVTPR